MATNEVTSIYVDCSVILCNGSWSVQTLYQSYNTLSSKQVVFCMQVSVSPLCIYCSLLLIDIIMIGLWWWRLMSSSCSHTLNQNLQNFIQSHSICLQLVCSLFEYKENILMKSSFLGISRFFNAIYQHIFCQNQYEFQAEIIQ